MLGWIPLLNLDVDQVANVAGGAIMTQHLRDYEYLNIKSVYTHGFAEYLPTHVRIKAQEYFAEEARAFLGK
jgi:hypothetical protein